MTSADGTALERRLEKLRALTRDSVKLAPIARLVEMDVLAADFGRVELQYAVKPEFMHLGRAVQGGIVTVYADIAMAMAGQTLCGDREFLVTSQLSISFLSPITEGPVTGEGRVVRKGRSTYFLESVVRGPDGTEMARATSIGVARPLPTRPTV